MHGGPVLKQYQQQPGHADKLEAPPQGTRSRLFLCSPFSSLELLGPLVSVCPPELSQAALTVACAPRCLSLLPWSSRCPSPLEDHIICLDHFKVCATTSCLTLLVYLEVHAQMSRLHCSQFPKPSQALGSSTLTAQSILESPGKPALGYPKQIG